ncbi:MAG: ABC transporter permease, partial [Candidatus Heimdallarchaeota archaeon]
MFLIFTIFLSTLSVLLDLSSISENIYGTDDNIMIFYDTQANTPFTSQVSSIYENGLQSITGIINISPEIFQSVMINDKPAFLRGANYNKISAIDGINILEGNKLDVDDPYGAIIGKRLAERLNIDISNQIEIRSIINDQVVNFNIVGVYNSNTITDDEVIINNNIARLLGSIDENHYNHYRIKYDPKVISSDQIQKLITQKYSFEPDIIIRNDTLVDELTVKISEKNGIILFDDQFEDLNLPFDLLRGEYDIQFYKNTDLIFKNDFEIPLVNKLRLELGNEIFYTEFNVTYKEIPVEKANAILKEINSDNKIEVQIEDGYFDLNLKLGSYNLTIYDDLFNNSVIFDVTGSENFNFDFNYVPITFSNSMNNTTYAQNNILLQFDDFDKDFKLEIGDITIRKNELNNQGEYLLNLENLDYEIKVESENGRLFELYQIRVNSSKDYILPQTENRDYIKFEDDDYLRFEHFGLLYD